MQQLANQSVDQVSTQPQQVYNKATNPANQLAKQLQDRQTVTSSTEAPRAPPQQDIIAQFQAHYARQEQMQKQPNTKAKRKTKQQQEKRAERLKACSELAAALDYNSPATTPTPIPTTYNYHSSPNEHNLTEMQQSERLLEAITLSRNTHSSHNL